MQTITDSVGRKAAADLFADFTFGYVADAILDGHLGSVLVDSAASPGFAALEARIGIFCILVLGGDPEIDVAKDFMRAIQANTEVLFASKPMFDQAKTALGDRAIERERHVLSSEAIDPDLIEQLASDVPAGFVLAPIDSKLAETLQTDQTWSNTGHGICFRSAEDFADRGFGFCLLKDGAIAAAASSFMISNRGIEIQINTAEAHRRQGLATVVAAALIRESLRRNLDPCWNASSPASADLASKLGYVQGNSMKTLAVVK